VQSDHGFSLVETLVALALLLIVSTTVSTGLLRMTEAQGTIWNRTEMHSGVRSATELLQQEVGQAGLITLPAPVSLNAAVVPLGAQTVGVSSVAGMFVGEQLTVGAGDTQEVVTITAINQLGNQITGTFNVAHNAGDAVRVYGGFVNGVVPTNVANGSTGTVLKLFGDINGDGNMVYVEYTCNVAAGNLYRNVVAFDAAVKPPLTAGQVLLSNIIANPGGAPCFTYQQQTVNGVAFTGTFVLDVAITLTVRTQQIDPVTKQFQTETKALLNVSPRNVFNTWEVASAQSANPLPIGLIQPTPPSVTTLLQ
jgi:prepilin-type N-terminal cleavage/methylation domain-containing protein